MFLSLANLAKQKARTLAVLVKSTASSHSMVMLRDRMVDKYEFIRFDPLIERNVIYREVKKIKTIGKKGDD